LKGDEVKMELDKKQSKQYQWKAVIEYVSFPNEKARQRAYEQYADTIIAGYRNKLKFLKEQEMQKNKGAKSLTGEKSQEAA
jgi:hypothetical protein